MPYLTALQLKYGFGLNDSFNCLKYKIWSFFRKQIID